MRLKKFLAYNQFLQPGNSRTDSHKLVVRDFDEKTNNADATKELKTEFPDGVFKCFVTRDNTRLTTAVISCNDETSYNKALEEGYLLKVNARERSLLSRSHE